MLVGCVVYLLVYVVCEEHCDKDCCINNDSCVNKNADKNTQISNLTQPITGSQYPCQVGRGHPL